MYYTTLRRICVYKNTQGLGECDWGTVAPSSYIYNLLFKVIHNNN